jgi:SAM-dependent methyltransferase
MLENHFDARVAEAYRRRWPHLFDPAVLDPAADFVADLASGGPVLELGVGTGRLAAALVARGLRVHGIELSPAMVEVLHAETPAGAIEITIGDMASTRVPGSFAVVVLVRNTIMNLTTQEQQVDCFRNAAAHLDAGGHFVIEVVVPPWQRLPPGERFVAFATDDRHVGIDEVDVATQRSRSHHLWLDRGERCAFSAPFRYVWPSELDLMAQLAGLRRRERWSDWSRAAFDAGSRSHVSVWSKEPAADRAGDEAGADR